MDKGDAKLQRKRKDALVEGRERKGGEKAPKGNNAQQDGGPLGLHKVARDGKDWAAKMLLPLSIRCEDAWL